MLFVWAGVRLSVAVEHTDHIFAQSFGRSLLGNVAFGIQKDDLVCYI